MLQDAQVPYRSCSPQAKGNTVHSAACGQCRSMRAVRLNVLGTEGAEIHLLCEPNIGAAVSEGHAAVLLGQDSL